MAQSSRSSRRSARSFYSIFSAAFFMAVSTALIAYFLSSYLKLLVGKEYVGLAFTVSYLISMVFINFFPMIVGRLGVVKSFMSILGVNFLALALLAYGDSSSWVTPVFVIFLSANALVWVNYDVLLETFSQDSCTGRTRALSLTLMNLGWVFTPLLAGWLIEKYGFPIIFTLSALLLIPPFFLVDHVKTRRLNYKYRSVRAVLRQVWRSKPLRSIFVISFLLSFFYSWMVIYTPLYLQGHGFDWPTIGKIFSVMLIPFVLFQYPAGWLADKFWGESEMISWSLVIMSLTTAAIFWFTTPLALALLLFGTRVGASIIEELRDSYFYKHVGPEDAYLIDAFRNTGPLAYVLGPLVATGVIHFLPMVYLYPVLAVIILGGLFFSLTMPDTK
ncbi:MFS transporter [Candidatus Uhrbacteria bacterium]|nr:MFS transporter [Candidatus Uhrbacteria bacterium]